MDNSIIQVQTTVESKKEAARLAKILLKSKLAACIQYFPITSTYWWKNQLEESEEYLLVIKATKGKFEKIVEQIKIEHTYEIPEIMGVAIQYVSKDYEKWIRKELE